MQRYTRIYLENDDINKCRKHTTTHYSDEFLLQYLIPSSLSLPISSVQKFTSQIFLKIKMPNGGNLTQNLHPNFKSFYAQYLSLWILK